MVNGRCQSLSALCANRHLRWESASAVTCSPESGPDVELGLSDLNSHEKGYLIALTSRALRAANSLCERRIRA